MKRQYNVPEPTWDTHPDQGCKYWHGDGRQCINCPFPECALDMSAIRREKMLDKEKVISL